jgi:hypothetical protein
METIVIGSSIESTTILAMLWTENPQVMTAAGESYMQPLMDLQPA